MALSSVWMGRVSVKCIFVSLCINAIFLGRICHAGSDNFDEGDPFDAFGTVDQMQADVPDYFADGLQFQDNSGYAYDQNYEASQQHYAQVGTETDMPNTGQYTQPEAYQAQANINYQQVPVDTYQAPAAQYTPPVVTNNNNQYQQQQQQQYIPPQQQQQQQRQPPPPPPPQQQQQQRQPPPPPPPQQQQQQQQQQRQPPPPQQQQQQRQPPQQQQQQQQRQPQQQQQQQQQQRQQQQQQRQPPPPPPQQQQRQQRQPPPPPQQQQQQQRQAAGSNGQQTKQRTKNPPQQQQQQQQQRQGNNQKQQYTAPTGNGQQRGQQQGDRSRQNADYSQGKAQQEQPKTQQRQQATRQEVPAAQKQNYAYSDSRDDAMRNAPDYNPRRSDEGHLFDQDEHDTTNLMEEWEKHMQNFIPEMLVTFSLSARTDEYFYETIESTNVYLRGGFFVGGEEGEGSVDFTITDPDGDVIFKRSKSEGLFYFTADKLGTYSFIVSNHRWMESKMVTFAIGRGAETALMPKHLTNAEDMVDQIQRQLKDIQAETSYLWIRQRYMNEVAESFLMKLSWLAFIEFGCLVVTAAFHARYIIGLVSDKRIL